MIAVSILPKILTGPSRAEVDARCPHCHALGFVRSWRTAILRRRRARCLRCGQAWTR